MWSGWELNSNSFFLSGYFFLTSFEWKSFINFSFWCVVEYCPILHNVLPKRGMWGTLDFDGFKIFCLQFRIVNSFPLYFSNLFYDFLLYIQYIERNWLVAQWNTKKKRESIWFRLCKKTRSKAFCVIRVGIEQWFEFIFQIWIFLFVVHCQNLHPVLFMKGI